MGAEASSEAGAAEGAPEGADSGEYMQQVMEEYQKLQPPSPAPAPPPKRRGGPPPGEPSAGPKGTPLQNLLVEGSLREMEQMVGHLLHREAAEAAGRGETLSLEPPAALVPLVAPGAGRDGRALPAKKRPRLNQYNSQESVSSNESAPAYRSLAGEPPALDRYASTAPPSRRGSYAGEGYDGGEEPSGGSAESEDDDGGAARGAGLVRQRPAKKGAAAAAAAGGPLPGTPLQKGTSSEALSATMEEALHQLYAGGTPQRDEAGGAAAAGGPGSAAAADDEVDDDAHAAAAALARRAQDLYAEQQAQAAAAAQAPAAASRQQFRCSQCGASHNGHHVCPYADQYAASDYADGRGWAASGAMMTASSAAALVAPLDAAYGGGNSCTNVESQRFVWTRAEDEVILQGVASFGYKWRRLASMLPNRSDDAVRNRWHRLEEARKHQEQHLSVTNGAAALAAVGSAAGISGAGTAADVSATLAAMNSAGAPAAYAGQQTVIPPPTAVATNNNTFTGTHQVYKCTKCGQPKKHHVCTNPGSLPASRTARKQSNALGLDDKAARLTWTPEEDQIILSFVAAHGPKWVEIAAQLPGRTDHAARNRYHRLQFLAQRGAVVGVPSATSGYDETLPVRA